MKRPELLGMLMYVKDPRGVDPDKSVEGEIFPLINPRIIKLHGEDTLIFEIDKDEVYYVKKEAPEISEQK